MVGKVGGHCRCARAGSIRSAQRPNRPTKIVTIHTQTRRSTMHIPILRETIRFANFPTATIAVGAVVSFDERGVDFFAAFRLFQRRFHLRFRTEHAAIIHLDNATFHTGFMHRYIDQIFAGLELAALRSPGFSGAFRCSLNSKRFQNCFLIRFVFIACDEPGNPVLQAFGGSLDQQFRVGFRAFAVDDFKHKFVFGIQRNVIPVVAAACVSRISCVAMLLFFSHEVPLFVELNLLRCGGKIPQVRREVFRHVRPRVLCNGSPCRNRLSIIGLFFSCHCLRQHVRESKQLFPLATGNRKKQSRDFRKISPCKHDNTTTALPCLARTKPEFRYYFRPERPVSGNFYSDNKTSKDRP